jgi:hypothetical protein
MRSLGCTGAGGVFAGRRRIVASRWSAGAGAGAEASRAGQGSNDDPGWYWRAVRSPLVRRCGACRRPGGKFTR